MENEHDLAHTFAERCAAARAYLRREMEARGLHEKDGWRIAESIRAVGPRTELVMRPIHLHLPTPDGIECVVEIDENESIESHCEP
jgi:hypothetical protein